MSGGHFVGMRRVDANDLIVCSSLNRELMEEMMRMQHVHRDLTERAVRFTPSNGKIEMFILPKDTYWTRLKAWLKV